MSSGEAPPPSSLIKRGPFEVGDQVQITDPKGRKHTVLLVAGKQFLPTKGRSSTTS